MAINQLPAANYTVSEAIPLSFVNCQASSSAADTTNCGTNAIHRNAYTGVAYDIPVGVHGGAFPYGFELTSAPSGMTIGENYSASDPSDSYGRITWPTPTAGNHTITVQVTDQLGNAITSTWTLVVGTANWVFVDGSAGTGGDGSIGSPYDSLDDVLTGHAGELCYIRASTLTLTSNFQLNTGTPVALIGYPSETADIAMTDGWFVIDGLDDGVFKNLTLRHLNMTAATQDRKCISQINTSDRNSFLDLTLTNFEYGADGNNNGAVLSSLGSINNDQFIHNWGVQASNMSTVIQVFKHRNSLIQKINVSNTVFNSGSGSSNGGAIKLKDGWDDLTIRLCELWDNNTWTSVNSCIDVAGQNSSGTDATDICYNTLYQPSTASQNGCFRMYSHNGSPSITNTHVYRNSLRADVGEDAEWSNGLFTGMTHTYEKNVVENGTLRDDGDAAGWYNLDNVEGTTVVFDANLQLTGAARIDYIGTHGSEIASTTSIATSTINQLPAANFTPAKFAMEAVSPRPDAESDLSGGAYYRYYHASMAYRARVAVRGGAWPLHYELTTAPAGATIGNNYGDADYGVISWASPTGASETFTVTVTDQEGATLAVTWTATLDASKFVFVDADVTGPGTGTFADPFSDIDDTQTGYGNKIAVLRGSTAQHVPTTNVRLDNTNYPSTLMGFPGESPVLDGASGYVSCSTGNGGDDLSIINIALDGSLTAPTTSSYAIRADMDGGTGKRFLVWGCTFRNQDQGTAVGENPSCVHFSGQTTEREYVAVVDCTQEATSIAPFIGAFDVKRFLIENNTISDIDLSTQIPTGGANGIHLSLKDRLSYLTVRANRVIAPSHTGVILQVAQQNNDVNTTDQEVCWNTFVSNSFTNRETGVITWGVASAGGIVPPNMFQYRNSVVVQNSRIPLGVLNYTGVYTNDLLIEDELWSTDDTLYVTANKGYGDEGGRYDGTSDSPLSNDGTPDELFSYGAVQPVLLGSSDVDANGLLTGAARTTYLGTVGAEVIATNPVVNDTFESYTLGSSPTGTTDSATWLTSGSRIEVSNVVANGGTKSLRFRYGPDASGSDSTAEQALTLDGAGYMELWLEWDMYTPSNFTHRDDTGSDNNKIIYLHNDYSEENGGIEYWPDRTPAALGQPANGKSYPTHVYRTSSSTPFGHYPQPNFGNIVFDPAEAGTWSRFKLHYKKSDAGLSNASVQFYKDDVLLLDRDNFDDYNPTRGIKPITGIKLMGWSNSGYLSETDFYMDNLYISDAGFQAATTPWTAAVDAAGTTVTLTLDEAYTTTTAAYTDFTIAGHTITTGTGLQLTSGTSFTLTVDDAIGSHETLVVTYDGTGDFTADSDSSVIAAGDIGLVNNSTVDQVAPVLSSPLGTPTGTTTATGTVTTDEDNGTLYWEVTASATPTSPNATFISDATSAGDTQAVSATGSQIVSATGLSAATSYYIHFLHVDAATNESIISTSAQFTTDAATGPTLFDAQINSAGSSLLLQFSEAVQESGSESAVTLSSGNTLAAPSGGGTTTLTYALSPYAVAGDVVTVSFAGGANLIEQNGGGADVEAFTDEAVTNASTETYPIVLSSPVPTIDATGTVLTFYTDDILGNLSTPQYTPFSLTGGYTFSNALFTGTGATFTITPEVQQGDVVTLAFTQAGGEFTSTTSGLELQTFSSRAVTNNSTVVTVPPVFTSAPAVSKTTVQGHTIRQTIDKTGVVYGVMVAADSPPPTPSQVKAGTDEQGEAPEAKSVATTAGNPCVLVFSSGVKNTEYDYYIVAEDSVPNLQTSVVKVTATTANLLFNGSGGKGLRPDEDSKKKVKMMWDSKNKRR